MNYGSRPVFLIVGWTVCFARRERIVKVAERQKHNILKFNGWMRSSKINNNNKNTQYAQKTHTKKKTKNVSDETRGRKKKGKRHNRVHPGHFATRQGTPFYPAGMSAADWSTLVFTLPRRKIAWVHPTKATFFQNRTLILDKYPVVSENETLPPAISPAEITLRSRQRAPKYASSRAKHTVRNRHLRPASSSSA